MTNQSLRTLAEAEAQLRYGDVKGMALLPSEYVMLGQKVGFIEGFIAGRTSVTRESIARRLAAHSTGGVCAPNDPSLAWETWLSEADAVLALLNGENDD